MSDRTPHQTPQESAAHPDRHQAVPGGANLVEPQSARTADFHLRLNQLLSTATDEEVGRASFRQLLLDHLNATGVAHLTRQSDGKWDLNPAHATGRVPRRSDFSDRLEPICDQAIQRESIQVESFLGFQCYYAPVQVFGKKDEILLLVTEGGPAASVSGSLYTLEIFIAYFALWLKGRNSHNDDWKLISLAALVELVSEVESKETLQSGCEAVVNELARHLNCGLVAICTTRPGGKRQKLRAVSGTSMLSHTSGIAKSLLTSLSETNLSKDLVIWPPSESGASIPLAHRQFAQETGSEVVISVPLQTPEGQSVGAMLLAGSRESLREHRLPNFLRAAAPRIASALAVVQRAQKTVVRRCLIGLGRFALGTRGFILLSALIGFVLLMMYPVSYHVRSECVVETLNRRVVVAPFEGSIEEGFVQAGILFDKGNC